MREISVLIILNNDGSPTSKRQFVRFPAVEHSFALKFRIPSGSDCLTNCGSKRVFLNTNYPIEQDGLMFYDDDYEIIIEVRLALFERNKFYQIPFVYHENSDAEACIPAVQGSGTFEYFVSYPGEKEEKKSLSGHFQIPPRLNHPMDAVVIKTFVPKWLGKMNSWNFHIERAADLGYNMVHFCPIQQRGISNSPYSIFDQMSISDDLFDTTHPPSEDEKFGHLRNLLSEMSSKYGIDSVIDIVWNHTACNSEWIRDHPDAGYNLENSPHLKVAYELDQAIMEFSEVIESDYGFNPSIATEEDLRKILNSLRYDHLPKYRLWEFFVIPVESTVAELVSIVTSNVHYYPTPFPQNMTPEDVIIKAALSQESSQGRNSWRISLNVALSLFHSDVKAFRESKDEKILLELKRKYQKILNNINLERYKILDQDLNIIFNNIESRVKYERLSDHGPKIGPISSEHPLVYSYFTRFERRSREADDPEFHALANNGWIWNHDPLNNFAGAGSKSYFLREVIVWGDCVKLRYGNGPEDSPFLWSHMKKYTELMASCFAGFRIDNCHSTPIHVAQYLLDAARAVKPNLYVLAELFSGSEAKDIVFVSKLGINSLIRESIVCWNPEELSRQIHRHGGQPVGSFCVNVENYDFSCSFETPPSVRKMRGCKDVPSTKLELIAEGALPHALFMDCTHDNESPHQKRSAEDALSSAALVSFTASAIGSVHGYDELYPELLNLVNEKREYTKSDINKGIQIVKKRLNELHKTFASQYYTEVYVHRDKDIIRVKRDNPVTHNGFIVIARTAFGKNATHETYESVRLRACSINLVIAASITVVTDKFAKNCEELCGFDCHLKYSDQMNDPFCNRLFELVPGQDSIGPYHDLIIKDFPNGSILVLEMTMSASAEIQKIHENLMILYPHSDWIANSFIPDSLKDCLEDLDFLDFNVLLFRSDEEERDFTGGHGSYNIPGHGSLAYCGLQGFVTVLIKISRDNNLGHALCQNLREGFWQLDYIVERLKRYTRKFPRLQKVINWLEENFSLVKKVPNYLTPKFFYYVVMTLYSASWQRITQNMPSFIAHGDTFVKSLALGSIQMIGLTESTGLHPLNNVASMAAGLPHFSSHHMRCWGRDVFISLRGLLLLTGRFKEAKSHIKAFVSVLRHGLVPNLLDAGRKPRYNARDAVWWCLQAIKEYCQFAPEGIELLKEKVALRFPDDDEYIDYMDPKCYTKEITVEDFIQNVLERHATGIKFREWNAGSNLDHVMRSEGFDIEVGTDWKTGFIYGGNMFNCGTWMDKMGESKTANTCGNPATPRDGSAVEIVGLSMSCITWVALLFDKGCYKYDSVTKPDGATITFKEWSNLIKANFEKYFYVPEDSKDDENYCIESKYVQRRGVYKDTHMATSRYRDFQLRPNFAIAMSVAPDLFDAKRARKALTSALEILGSSLGMKTLDPQDWEYRGDYNNDDNSSDPLISRGFNYHQGPEWVWIYGYFMRAMVKFQVKPNMRHFLQKLLIPHRREILCDNEYAGLPELTNGNGLKCRNSCPTQAWSLSCLLDALYDVQMKSE